MSYVANRRGLYRTGFRQIDTNPYAATQLGLTPFDPERLRPNGLGQSRPFTRAGGYGLHGLGDIVPNGAIVQYQGQWEPDINTPAAAQLAAVVAAVSKDGLHVVNSSENSSLWNAVVAGNPFTATLQLQVTSGGFSDPSDIAAIVDHEVYMVTGQMPAGSQVSVVSLTAPAPGALAIPQLPSAGAVSNWLQNNANYALWIGLGLIMLKQMDLF